MARDANEDGFLKSHPGRIPESIKDESRIVGLKKDFQKSRAIRKGA